MDRLFIRLYEDNVASRISDDRFAMMSRAHELIKAIYVGAPDKSSGKRRQSIHICYDLIGFIPLSKLMEQELA